MPSKSATCRAWTSSAFSHLMSLVSGGGSKLEATFHGFNARGQFVLAGEGQGQTDLDSCDRPMKTDAGASGKSISRFRKLDRQCHEPGLDKEAEAVRSLRGERLFPEVHSDMMPRQRGIGFTHLTVRIAFAA
jgi:hypothetical protein